MIRSMIDESIHSRENHRVQRIQGEFRQAQRELNAEGFIVVNPAELPEGMQPSDYMRICFAMMDCADIVAFLPDYSQSRGARLEFDWCQYTGKQTVFLGKEMEV